MKFSFFKRSASNKTFQETLEKYQKASEQNPGDLRIRIKIAELYLEHNQKAQAMDEYLAAARAYQDKRLFQIAVAIYKHIISIDPGQVNVYTALAELHLKNGFVGDSVAVLERLAHHYYTQDMKYEATQVLKKISEIDRDNKFFKLKVAKFYEGKDLSEEETLRAGPKDKWELIEQQNESARPATESGSDYFDLEAALEDDVSINISTIPCDEEDASAERSASTLSPKTVFTELKSMMESESDKDSPQFHYNLGVAYQRCQQIEEAAEEFRAALPSMEHKIECYLRLTDCCIMLKKFEEARAYITQGLGLEGLTTDQKLHLEYYSALIYKAEGDTENALKMFQQIHSQNKDFKNVNEEIKNLSSHS